MYFYNRQRYQQKQGCLLLLIVLIEATVIVIVASYKTFEKIIELELQFLKWLIKNGFIYIRIIKKWFFKQLNKTNWYQNVQRRRAYRAYANSTYAKNPKP